MGAQQMKSSNEKYMLYVGKKERIEKNNSKKDKSKLSQRISVNEIQEPTIMSQHELDLVSLPNDRITVADFAKIKVEPTPLHENINVEAAVNDAYQSGSVKKTKCELLDLYKRTEGPPQSDRLLPATEFKPLQKGSTIVDLTIAPFTELEPFLENEMSIGDVSAPVADLKPLLDSKTDIERKNELLQAYFIESSLRSIKQTDVIIENNSDLSITVDASSVACDKILLPIKAEVITVNNEHHSKDIIHTCDKSLLVEDNNSLMYFSQEEHVDINKSFKPTKIETQNSQEPHVVDLSIESDDTRSLSEDTYSNTFSVIRKEINENKNIVKRTKNENLVKNPFSFLKKKIKKVAREENNPSGNISQRNFLNNSIKSEPVSIDLELENATSSTKRPESPKDFKENNIVLKEVAEQSSPDFNEIIIKSENISVSEYSQDVYKSTSSHVNYLTCDLDSSSLDVNLSNGDSDIDDLESNVSINETKEFSRNFSLAEIFSEENDLQVQHPKIKTMKTPKKQKPHQKNIKRLQTQNKKQAAQSKKICKTKLKTLKRKINQPKKYTDKDASYTFAKAKKNVNKTKKKPGKMVNKTIIKKADAAGKNFPRPLKLERSTLQNEHNVAMELPKPMMFKRELDLNIKNKKLYQKPEFQPRVRLQRIKSEELLIPLKTRRGRKPRKFKSAENVNKRFSHHQRTSDLLIQRAYSLNTCTKLNRLSTDHDHCYCSAHTSLNKSLTSSYGMPTNTSAESFHEAESKYFRQQVMYSSNPDVSSICNNGRIDSGVSTSAPTSPHHSSGCNKSILLEIAAERAFINNHLMYFGYSPIQFDLYNNLNDLNIFLKYLLGKVNMN